MNDINDGCFNVGVLFQSSGTVHAHSLTWLVVALNGTKPLVGHTCVGPKDVCCETHHLGTITVQCRHFAGDK